MTAAPYRYLDRHGRLVDLGAQTNARKEARKLALRMIDIGFREIAKKLHPDAGGSQGAMARLNRAREILKARA